MAPVGHSPTLPYGVLGGVHVSPHLVGRMLEDAQAELRFSLSSKQLVQQREVH